MVPPRSTALRGDFETDDDNDPGECGSRADQPLRGGIEQRNVDTGDAGAAFVLALDSVGAAAVAAAAGIVMLR